MNELLKAEWPWKLEDVKSKPNYGFLNWRKWFGLKPKFWEVDYAFSYAEHRIDAKVNSPDFPTIKKGETVYLKFDMIDFDRLA